MNPYELSNTQRKYFGLVPVNDNWDKEAIGDSIVAYFESEKIVKILNYSWGYLEYDTNINTNGRVIILPQTSRGKKQRLTIPKLLKIKGCAIQFSGSFSGGGIHVYDHNRSLSFIRSFAEDGEIESFQDIDNWISNYISIVPDNYFDWLGKQLSQKRLKVKAKEGDIVAFKISHNEYGFARILLDVFSEIKKGDIIRPIINWIHPRSLIVAPYAFYADTLQVDIDTLINRKTLPTLCIFDSDVYRGEMPIIGHKPLSEEDRLIPFPETASTSVTLRYTKTDIQTFIATH